MTVEVVEGYFKIAKEDIEAAERLLNHVPRAAAYHLEQAAEKMVKAFLVAEGEDPGISHDIATLVDMLPSGHEWKADLAAFSPLSRFATSFRYPTPTGRVPAPPDINEMRQHGVLLRALFDDALDWCRERISSTPRP